MKKHILPVLVSMGLVLTLCSCGSGPQQQPNGISKGAAVSDGKIPSKSSLGSYPVKLESCQPSPEKAAQAQFVSQGQTFTMKKDTDQFTFQLKNAAVSKKLTGFQKADIQYPDFLKITADAAGNLSSAHSYVYLDFMVKNMHAKEAKICLGNFEIVPVFADSTTTDGGFELQAFDKPQHRQDSQYLWFYKFQPNEETTFRMLYMLPDKELKNNLYLEVNPTGASVGNHNPDADYEEKRFIKLNLS